MSKAALVIMAAGIGSRFGKGTKQLTPVGPHGETIIEYSIYDALEAGFDKVVFIIRKELEKEFREMVGDFVSRHVEVVYVYQDVKNIPEKYRERCKERTKPWGTGQAVLCCKDVVNEPFLVINADDYYGKDAYKKAFSELTKKHTGLYINMVSFVLKNTLSENGTVTRGVCRVRPDGMLEQIEETYSIKKEDGKITAEQNDEAVVLDENEPVSMNMWGFTPAVFEILENGFYSFLKNLGEREEKKEYLLPIIVKELLAGGEAEVKVLNSEDMWFGVTYQEDREYVAGCIGKLVDEGRYPDKLF